jgi:cytochrome bd-type quinol oxidase subunit 2
MARVWVELDRFERGDFPDVCAKTGEAAEYLGRVEATRTPEWPCLLLLFGILPYLIAAWFSTDRTEGDVPLSARAVRRLQRLAWVRRPVGLLALGLVIAGVLLESAGVTVAGFGLLIAYMVLLVVGAVWSVGGRLDRQAGAVQLTGVHDRFKEAVASPADR